MSIAELIARQKNLLGLSDREFAQRMVTPGKPNGITAEGFSYWRDGTSQPRQVPPDVIARALEVDLSEVLDALGIAPKAIDRGPSVTRTAVLASIATNASHLGERDAQSVLDFIDYLLARSELSRWNSDVGGLAGLYSEDEPEYTLADVR